MNWSYLFLVWLRLYSILRKSAFTRVQYFRPPSTNVLLYEYASEWHKEQKRWCHPKIAPTRGGDKIDSGAAYLQKRAQFFVLMVSNKTNQRKGRFRSGSLWGKRLAHSWINSLAEMTSLHFHYTQAIRGLNNRRQCERLMKWTFAGWKSRH